MLTTRAPRRGNRTTCRCLYLLTTFVLPFCLCLSVQAQLLTGSYTGDGTDNRAIVQLGFLPSVVIVKIDDNKEAVIRTSTMTGDNSKQITGGALAANWIQSFESSGFTVGSDDRVNKNNKVVYWAAFEAVDGELAVGSYTGNGADDRTIDISDTSASTDFQPAYVIVMSADNKESVQRSSATPGQKTFQFDGTPRESNHLQSLLTNGFQIGDDDRVNKNGVIFHYVAWKAVTGKMAVGSYAGDGNDNRNITGVGFDPEYVIVRSETDRAAVHYPASLGLTVDDTLHFEGKTNEPNHIQSIRPGGCTNCFQVGTKDTVNHSSREYFWVAFARDNPTAVTLKTFTATKYQDGILLQWRTGWEVNNLGFHVYRDDAEGQRVRLTPSIIAGSALMVAGVPLTAGHSYMWGDPGGYRTDRYWLVDMDLDGTRTWHGPVAVPQGALMEKRSVLTVRQSTFLKHLGRKLDTRSPLQRAVETGTAVHLAVQGDGWQVFRYADLVAAGMPPAVDPRRLQLFADGKEALVLVRGDEDGSFDPGDTVKFTPWRWEATRAYWLIEGVRGGMRIRPPQDLR